MPAGLESPLESAEGLLLVLAHGRGRAMRGESPGMGVSADAFIAGTDRHLSRSGCLGDAARGAEVLEVALCGNVPEGHSASAPLQNRHLILHQVCHQMVRVCPRCGQDFCSTSTRATHIDPLTQDGDDDSDHR